MIRNTSDAFGDLSVIELIDDISENFPKKIAVSFREENLDYKELQHQSCSLASYLRSQGIKKGDIIGVAVDRSPSLIIALLAILRCGAAYLPLDPDYPIDRINFMIDDCEAKLVITQKLHDAKLNPKTPRIFLEDIRFTSYNHGPVVSEIISPVDLAYIIYTSGSTGLPKGVQIEHGSLVNFFLSMQQAPGISQNDIMLAITTISFDIAGLELFLPLISGAQIVIASSENSKSAKDLIRLIQEQDISIMQATPATWNMLIENGWGTKSTLKILCGGEPLSKNLAEKLLSRSKELWNMYGPTETTIWSTIKQITCVEDISVGAPIADTNIYILNDRFDLLPHGEIGEIAIGGKGTARGYMNRSDLTTEKFITITFNETKQRVYRTGDLGFINENGELRCLGRIDDQVKIRGHRIELGEIEHQLLKIPAIKQAVVTCRNEDTNQRLIAYLIVGKDFEKSETLKLLESALPEFMIPRAIILLDKLPLTENGKVDKKSLPNPDVHHRIYNRFLPPRTHIERILMENFRSIFRIPEISIHDNFFELGGNSLLAQKLANNLVAVGYQIPITKLYQCPTIAKLASFIEGREDPTPNVRRDSAPYMNEDIAVISLAGRFPGATNVQELWENLKQGKESISFFSDTELDPSISNKVRENPNYVRARGIIAGVDQFDPLFFGISPRAAELMDPQQRIFLEIAWEALESAGYTSNRSNHIIGVFAGSNYNSYFTKNVLFHPELIEQMGEFQVMTLNDKDYLASRTAYSLNLTGPAITVQSACSTSLLAIAQAVESIRKGQCDMALAGGISITTPVKSGYIFEEGSILSRDGHCKPFDADASGTVFSDGGGVVLLKSKIQAEENGDNIFAIIRGVGVNNDGSSKGSFTAPSAEGQAGAILMALSDAKVNPASISYIETHGTATPLGDPIEIEGLKLAFGHQEAKQFCSIGSIKSNIGHLNVAAGIAGFIKTCLSLHHKLLPPTLHFSTSNPLCDIENSPFKINDKLSNWDKPQSIKRAGVSSFGVGGTNVHVILEEYDNSVVEVAKFRPFELITWSSKTEESSWLYQEKLASYVAQHSFDISDLAFKLQTCNSDFNIRKFCIAANKEDLLSQLTKFSNVSVKPIVPNQLIFVFPGQGSQYVNMGKELYNIEPVFKAAVDQCSVIINEFLGEDIRLVMYPSAGNLIAEKKIGNTYYTQIALFITEYALAKLWMSWELAPTIFIGHSIGEFVAAHFSGIIGLKDSLYLIVKRAQLMAGLAEGRMLAVRASEAMIYDTIPHDLSIAAVNSPNLCVVAGSVSSTEDFSIKLSQIGITSKFLASNHAFHSSMMDSIVEDFYQWVSSIQLNIPTTPIISTVTGTWLKDSEATNPRYWADHLRSTVRFADAIKTAAEEEGLIILECGPGNSSTALIRQQVNADVVRSFASLEVSTNQTEYLSLVNTLGQLWANGCSIDWKAFYSRKTAKRMLIPCYAFDRKSYWLAAGGPIKTIEKNFKISENVKDFPHNRDAGNDSLTLREIKAIINNITGLDVSSVPSYKSFIEIGLDSLLLTQLAQNFQNRFNVPITFRKLNEELNSLDLLAEYIITHSANKQWVNQEEKGINKSTIYSKNNPPVPGARLGRDAKGNTAWFVQDKINPGKYLQIDLTKEDYAINSTAEK